MNTAYYGQNKVENPILAKWERTGLLEGLSKGEAAQCATLLEGVHQAVILTDELWKDSQLSHAVVLIYPIARRLFTANRRPNPTWLVQDFTAWYNKNKAPPDCLCVGIDYDVNLCDAYAKNYQGT